MRQGRAGLQARSKTQHTRRRLQLLQPVVFRRIRLCSGLVPYRPPMKTAEMAVNEGDAGTGEGRLTLAVLFADLAGFTALTEAHGDVDAADIAERFSILAQQVLFGDARIVKTIGDAVMIVTSDPAHAGAIALALLRAVEGEKAFPTVRIGLHLGPVVERAGDVFGTTVNVAARLAAHAHAGQLLTTAHIAERLKDGDDLEIRSLGELTFKHISGSVEVFWVEDRGRPPSVQVTDPVCHMVLDVDDAAARLSHAERSFYFCSITCAQRFIDAPEQYATVG